MTQDDLKRQAALAALDFLPPPSAPALIGVGTGSTVNHFIRALAEPQHRARVLGAVSSSVASTQLLESIGVPVVSANAVTRLTIYVDGADEIDAQLNMLKGGGGALTREKIVADLADQFVCIVDASKYVTTLGQFPLPVEVIPMAEMQVTRALLRLGGAQCVVKRREGFVTDNGNLILDVHGLSISDPHQLETALNHVVGVVCNRLFARRGADMMLLASAAGVRTERRA